MAIQIKRYIVILLLSVVFSFQAHAQVTENKQVLPQMLSTLASKFKVQFN